MNADIATINSYLDQLFCATLRSLGFVAFWPLDYSNAAFVIKLTLAIAFGASGIFFNPEVSTAVTITNISLLCSEVIFGIVLALPIALVLSFVSWWAELFDTARGQNLGSILDPMQQTENDSLSALLGSATWILLLSSPVVLQASGLLLKSYRTSPVGALANVWSRQLYLGLLEMLHEGTMTCISMAMPFAGLFLSVEIIVALAGKLLPNVSLAQESFLLKTALGAFGILAIGVSGVDTTLIRITEKLALFGIVHG